MIQNEKWGEKTAMGTELERIVKSHAKVRGSKGSPKKGVKGGGEKI